MSIRLVLNMMAHSGKKAYGNLLCITQDPMHYQKELLLSLLEKNKDTEIGRRLGYKDIHSIEDFQNKIPLTDFDFYAESIERMANGQKNILTSDKIEHFNVTSGTLGNPKRIPVTEAHINIFSSYYAKYINYLYKKEKGKHWTHGMGLTLTEGKYTILPSGISCGSASSLSAARMGRIIPFLKLDLMGMMYTSPIEARQPEPNTPTRFLHALFALREKNITYGSATFSSYLLEFFRYIEQNWKMFVDIIRTGEFPQDLPFDEKQRSRLRRKLNPSAKRANELEEIFSRGFDEPIVKKIWPNMTFITTVGGAGFQPYTDKLKAVYCGPDIEILYLGLSASEGMFSVPFEFENSNSVFIPNSLFYEFLPVSPDGETDYSAKCLTLNQVEVGKDYELVITNLGGLVRYKMKDVITVTGYYNKTPTMQFKNRSGFAISMYGEKTSEKALSYMVEKTADELGFDYYDYAVCPDDDEAPGRYVLCLELRDRDKLNIDYEQIRACAQKHLSVANPSIGKKMDTGVVKPLGLRILNEETFLLYRDLIALKGRSAAQLKPVHVLNTPFLKKFFYKLSNEINTTVFDTKKG